MKLVEKLSIIQKELKAPKGQRNTFGNYNYRSAEDILEAVKPLLFETKTALTISDDLILIGDRYYIKATVTLRDAESMEVIENVAFAREEETKKGMDGSQITGTASSYARKYAMNGLFAIDDTKDADTDEHKKQQEGDKKKDEVKMISKSQIAEVVKLFDKDVIQEKMLPHYKVKTLTELTFEQAQQIIKRGKESQEKANQ